MKSHLINLLKLIVGIGLLYWLFRKLPDPARLWQQIASADKGLLLLGACCYAAAVALSGIKWGILLRAIGIPVATPRLLAYQWVAEFFNNFLPAQVGGDVMRGYALATDTHRTADAAASVLIDRFIGLLVFMLAAALASTSMLLWGRPDGSRFAGDALVSMRLIVLGSIGISFTLLLMLVALLSRRLKQGVERLLAHLPLANRLVPIWQKLASAFNAYRHQYQALLLTAISSVLIVGLTSVNIWLITQAIAHNQQVLLIDVLAINPIIVLVGLLVPLSPGGLGVRQGAFVATFSLIGASGELGLAVGLMQQLIGYLVSLPGGLLWMRGGLSGQRTQSSLAFHRCNRKTSPSMSDSKPYLSENEARQLYIGDDAAHDFDHILRVTRLGAYLAECEGADIEVVRLAALLHDVPANEAVYKAADAGNVRRTHHLAAADFARQLLHARGMENERIVNVAHCIEAHRFRDQSIQPTTLEAQCLYDADKLDSIGAIGVARAFAYAGHEGNRLWTEPWIIVSQQMAKPTGADYTPVHEFVYKLQRLLATLHTATAQRIGAERHAFMVTFFSQLDAEMNFF